MEAYLRLQAAGIPSGYVASVSDLQRSEQYAAVNYFDSLLVDATGPVKVPGIPWTIDGLRRKLGPPPGLGEHNHEQFAHRLGGSETEVNAVRERDAT